MIPDYENAIWKMFKDLTGYNNQDMADKFGISRQRVHEMKRNYSLLYMTSSAYMMNCMIDDKIQELEHNIEILKSFKSNIRNYATR